MARIEQICPQNWTTAMMESAFAKSVHGGSPEVTVGGGRRGADCLTTKDIGRLNRTLPVTTRTELHYGLAFCMDTAPWTAGTWNVLSGTAANETQIQFILTVSAGGVMSLYRGSLSGTLLCVAADVTITPGQQHWLDLYYLLSSSKTTADGKFTLYVDGNLAGSSDASATRAENDYSVLAGYSLGGGVDFGHTGVYHYMDIMVNDTTGAQNTGRIGDSKLFPLTLTAVSSEGTRDEMTRTGGSTKMGVLSDKDTGTYLSTTDGVQTFTFDAISVDAVQAVSLQAFTRQQDEGSKIICPKTWQSATLGSGTSKGLNAAQDTMVFLIMDSNPSTAAAWDAGNMPDEIGMEIANA